MKRSTVNEILRDAHAYIRSFGCQLPPFAYWHPDELAEQVSNGAQMVRDRALGWDITDFGLGRFDEIGLVLFTERNGSADNVRTGRGMLYGEKIMISRDQQRCPMHRHIHKTEDIINRGGATLALELFKAAEDGSVDEAAPVPVISDGRSTLFDAGELLRLASGESVTLEPDTWHAFWGEGGRVLIGEVSNVNDDRTDNIFRDKIGRFAAIEEDEPALHMLVSDYEGQLV